MMKFLFFVLLLIANSIVAAAQCAVEPTIPQTGKIIAAREFSVKEKISDEMILTLEAAAENSSWAAKDVEGAVLTVFVDGKYHQDVMLFGGAEKFVYRVALGEFETGKHRLEIVFNEARSAKNSKKVKIYSLKIAAADKFDKSSADAAAIADAPFIYARPDTIDRFSDVPLITYYEIFPNGANAFKIRYTTIFTNEDGGTQSAALMARWGRMTDIEWIYEIEVKDGKLVSEIYQGANHITKNYAGKRVFGSHPLIFDATVNNNFADTGCSDLRFAPLAVRADLSSKSRETVMDENGWTYRIMAQEALREGRVNAAKLDANTIADPREYIYVEVRSDLENAAVAVEAEMPDGEKISSDAGFDLLRVNRSGYVRIALRLPPQFSDAAKFSLNVRCSRISRAANAAEAVCRDLNLIKIVRLDRDYYPHEEKFNGAAKTYRDGEAAVFTMVKPK